MSDKVSVLWRRWEGTGTELRGLCNMKGVALGHAPTFRLTRDPIALPATT